MVGENLEIYWSEMAKIHLNYLPWCEKIIKFNCLSSGKNALKVSTMVGENFEIYWSQMAKNLLKLSTLMPEHFLIYCLSSVEVYIFNSRYFQIDC